MGLFAHAFYFNQMKNPLLSATLIQKWIDLYQPKALFIAYSGGLDSSALLHLSSFFKGRLPIHALHVNHGLSDFASLWENHCRSEAQRLGVYFHSIMLTPPQTKSNLENWARKERYQFFNDIVSQYSNSLLLTAHHMEDQAESFLLQSLRGSGIDGLSAIAEDKPFGNHRLIRPFLSISKNVLKTYCQYHSIHWVEDESNQSLKFTRNALRHKIFPELDMIKSNAAKTIARSAKWCQETKEVLDEYLQNDLSMLLNQNGSIDIIKLGQFSLYKQKLLVHFWLSHTYAIYINHAQLEQIIQGVNQKLSNKLYPVKGHMIEIQFSSLSVQTPKSSQTATDIDNIILWLNSQEPKLDISINDISIRERESSDRCRYPGRAHKQKLKILFQELKIPVHEREKLKVITWKDNPQKIIALYPFFICP